MLKINKFLKFCLVLIITFSLSIFTLIFYATKIEPQSLIVNKKTLYIPDNKKQLDGLKIAVLSDLHLGSPYIDSKKLEKIVSVVNHQKPDFIFILGDIDAVTISTKYKNKEHIINQFKKLNSKYGTYAIYGNHDFRPKNVVEPIYQKSHIPLIVDDFIRIKTKNGFCCIAGLNDKWGHNSQSEIHNLISKIPQNDLIILLAHNPDVFPKVPERINLTISGHNHGGQIYLPFIGGLFVPSKYNQRFVKGYIVENNKHLYVSSGIGNCAPLRFGNIPEINILIIKPQTKNHKIINTKPKKNTINLMQEYRKIKNNRLYKNFKSLFYKKSL